MHVSYTVHECSGFDLKEFGPDLHMWAAKTTQEGRLQLGSELSGTQLLISTHIHTDSKYNNGTKTIKFPALQISLPVDKVNDVKKHGVEFQIIRKSFLVESHHAREQHRLLSETGTRVGREIML